MKKQELEQSEKDYEERKKRWAAQREGMKLKLAN